MSFQRNRGGARNGPRRANLLPRSVAMLTNRPIKVGARFVPGMKERILCTFRTSSPALRDHFAALCIRLGLSAKEVQSFGWSTVFDVAGAQDSLSQLCWDKACLNWEYVLRSRIPNPAGARTTSRPPHPMETTPGKRPDRR